MTAGNLLVARSGQGEYVGQREPAPSTMVFIAAKEY